MTLWLCMGVHGRISSSMIIPSSTITANVKLVGHANARQKIQLHRKLKEELTDMQRRCKVEKYRHMHAVFMDLRVDLV